MLQGVHVTMVNSCIIFPALQTMNMKDSLQTYCSSDPKQHPYCILNTCLFFYLKKKIILWLGALKFRVKNNITHLMRQNTNKLMCFKYGVPVSRLSALHGNSDR